MINKGREILFERRLSHLRAFLKVGGLALEILVMVATLGLVAGAAIAILNY